jgi:hypothetical protein
MAEEDFRFYFLGFDELLRQVTERWQANVTNFELELLDLVNTFVSEQFGDAVRYYDLPTLTGAVNLMELKEETKRAGARLSPEITRKLVYRLVRHLVQTNRTNVRNQQKYKLGLMRLGMAEYEYSASDSKKDLDPTVAVITLGILVAFCFMFAVDRFIK